MKLKFSLNFIGSSIHCPLFTVKVAREGEEMHKHDKELVEQLNAHGISSTLVTAAVFNIRDLESGQDCFISGGYVAMPLNYTKKKLNETIARLDGLTVEEIAQYWVKADKHLYNLIENISKESNDNYLINQLK